MCRDPVSHGAGVERTLQAKSPRERSAAFGEIQTGEDGMHMCSPPRSSGGVIWYDAAGWPVDVRDHTQKVRLRRALPASHTRAHRLHSTHSARTVYRHLR
jgi:hypothetical protein